MLTAFRESSVDGKPGDVSLRRILATVFSMFAAILFVAAFKYAALGWVVFIPGAVCVLATLLLLFFTTWADVAAIISAAKGQK